MRQNFTSGNLKFQIIYSIVMNSGTGISGLKGRSIYEQAAGTLFEENTDQTYASEL